MKKCALPAVKYERNEYYKVNNMCVWKYGKNFYLHWIEGKNMLLKWTGFIQPFVWACVFVCTVPSRPEVQMAQRTRVHYEHKQKAPAIVWTKGKKDEEKKILKQSWESIGIDIANSIGYDEFGGGQAMSKKTRSARISKYFTTISKRAQMKNGTRVPNFTREPCVCCVGGFFALFTSLECVHTPNCKSVHRIPFHFNCSGLSSDSLRNFSSHIHTYSKDKCISLALFRHWKMFNWFL